MAANGGITDPQEFWNALGRLYESILEIKNEIANLTAATSELKETTTNLREGTADLFRIAELHQNAITELSHMVASHEKRLDYNEVVNVALREDLRRIDARIQAIHDKLDGRS